MTPPEISFVVISPTGAVLCAVIYVLIGYLVAHLTEAPGDES
jgi:hypothetical protein